MPARSVETAPGHRVMVFHCETCGAPASFGEGVNLREALRTGDVSHAGRWFCGYLNNNPQCVAKAEEA